MRFFKNIRNNPKIEKGAKGDTGDKGPRGDAGDKGPIGDIGPVGEKGLKGDTGQRGAKGETGLRGKKGDPGDPGDKGPIGPSGESSVLKGETGPKGDRGPIGNAGLKGPIGDRGEIYISSGEMTMKKICAYINEKKILVYLQLSSPGLSENIVGDVNNRFKITDIQGGCIFLENKGIVPIKNIESISFISSSEDYKNILLNDIDNIFTKTKDCTKNAKMDVFLDDNGDPILQGDLGIDYEYIVQCNCINDTSIGNINSLNGGKEFEDSICIGKKIDICNFTNDYANKIGRFLEISRNNSKQVIKITTRLRDFTDVSEIIGNISIGPICFGTAVLTHMKSNGRYIITILNLDKVSAIELT